MGPCHRHHLRQLSHLHSPLSSLTALHHRSILVLSGNSHRNRRQQQVCLQYRHRFQEKLQFHHLNAQHKLLGQCQYSCTQLLLQCNLRGTLEEREEDQCRKCRHQQLCHLRNPPCSSTVLHRRSNPTQFSKCQSNHLLIQVYQQCRHRSQEKLRSRLHSAQRKLMGLFQCNCSPQPHQSSLQGTLEALEAALCRKPLSLKLPHHHKFDKLMALLNKYSRPLSSSLHRSHLLQQEFPQYHRKSHYLSQARHHSAQRRPLGLFLYNCSLLLLQSSHPNSLE